MKTFDGWRAVGRAMRWARQQDGVMYAHEHGAWLGHEWVRNSMDVVRAGGRGGQQGYGLMADLGDGRHVESAGLNAAAILSILAALDLIPAELALPEQAAEPGIAHRLTEVEAHAITNMLAAVEHIPVDAECRADAVYLRPRRELTTEEKVTVLRAVRSVSDAKTVWAVA